MMPPVLPQVFRMVVSVPYEEEPDTGGGPEDCWASPKFFLDVKKGQSEDHAILRPALTPGLVAVAENNLRQGAKTLRFFETGKQFRNIGGGKATDLEADSVALLIGGEAVPLSWSRGQSRMLNIYDLKAAIESIFGGQAVQFSIRPREGFLLCGDIQLDGKPIGTYAQLLPSRAREIGFKSPIYLAELDQKKVLATRKTSFQGCC